MTPITTLPELVAGAAAMVDKRITNMVLRHPFFSTVLLNLDIGPASVGTACTDGTRLLYDPDFIDKLEPGEVTGLLAHEIMHVALLHPFRVTKDMDPKLANVAMDYEINGYLDTYNKEWVKSRGGEPPFPLPKGGLIDHKYDDMAFEQIYAELARDLEKQGKGPGEGQGGGQSQQGDGDGDGEGGGSGSGSGQQRDPGNFGRVVAPGDDPGDGSGGQTDASGKQTSGGKPCKDRMDWESIVTKAEQVAKMQGALPGGFASKLEKFRRPEIPWEEYLRRYFDARSMDDFDSRVSDRRYVGANIFLPTLNSESLDEIAVGIDTSGSIYYDKSLFERFMGELSDILSRHKPRRTTLMQCDTRITDVTEFTPGDPFDPGIKVKGGGGTDFRPFFDHLAKQNIEPKVLVIFTDGYGDYPTTPPHYDVVWVDYGNYPKYPFGDVIRTKPKKP